MIIVTLAHTRIAQAIRSTAAKILSGPDDLNLAPELTEHDLPARLHISAAGEVRQFPGINQFPEGGTNFPWRSLTALLARRNAAQHGLP